MTDGMLTPGGPAALGGCPTGSAGCGVPLPPCWPRAAGIAGALLLLLLLLLLLPASVGAGVPMGTDRTALEALYDATGGDSWTRRTNWKTTVGDWHGVTTDMDGRVTYLNLAYNKLSGSIPAALGNLSNLIHLNLSNNKLSGSIPAALGQLTSLTILWLYNNELSGSIPVELGQLTSLTILRLFNNELSGSIPAALGQLTSLTNLDLDNNELSGSIPAALGQLRNLTELRLTNNKLSGSIPPALGDLTALRQLWLFNNELSGSIPPALGQLRNLRYLRLTNNKLSGSIPAELGQLSALTEMRLDNNELSGSIPAELGQLSALTDLRLTNNKLSGPIPAALGQLSALTQLLLYNNALLRDPLPSTLTNLTISELHMQNTQITATTTDAALATWLGGRTVTTGTRESIRTIPLDAENTTPRGLWSDETTLWVADPDAAGDGTGKVFAYTLADGSRAAAQDIALDPANTYAEGLWSDGTTLWVSDLFGHKLYAYALADRSRDTSKDMDVIAYPRGLWGNATTLWVANWRHIYAYRRSNGSRDTSKDITPFSANNYPRGLWADGTTLWSPSDRDDARLYAYDLATGQHDPTRYHGNDHILDPANANPQGLWSDGTTLWVNDLVQHKVYAYRNQGPQAVGTLPDQTLTRAGSALAQRVPVASAFRDPDGDALTYTATSSHTSIAAVMVAGAEVTVFQLAVGRTTVTVTATDAAGSNLTATQSFEVTVVADLLPNQGPQAVGALPARTMAVNDEQRVPVASAFRDPDGDALTYTATSSHTSIATVMVAEAEVTVTPLAGDRTTITVTATDAAGSNMMATQSFEVTVVAGGVTPPTRLPPPVIRPPGGGSGSGGGGGSSRDRHGDTAAQATVVSLGEVAPWSASTTGQINTRGDLDYFRLSVPHAGVLVVETTGSTDTVGTVWQADEELDTADSGGMRRNFRLRVRVEAGPVVVAVEGNGTRTGAYTLETILLVGFLENPGRGSFQSGIGVLSGWVCDADTVELELNGTAQEAAYGTERLDTAGVCGDTNNGFGLLFNWNLLGDGEHTVVALVDGVELGRARVTVTTLGQEFLRGVEGECVVEDFPTVGETVRLEWQQTSQNFVIAGGAAPGGVPFERAGDLAGYLENPGPNSFQSGIGVLSGWVCDADTVEIAIGDTGRQVAAYGTERLDTAATCGDTDNGFGLLFNWNLLGEGEHTVIAYVDGEELGRATVRVTTLGAEFLRGAEGECVVEDFPMLGETVTLEWQQNQQNFVITEVQDDERPTPVLRGAPPPRVSHHPG